jgi:hypothetical protein
MGTVLLAERAFGDSKQKVALKLIRGFRPACARAAARERSLLAGLTIRTSPALDAGETDDQCLTWRWNTSRAFRCTVIAPSTDWGSVRACTCS